MTFATQTTSDLDVFFNSDEFAKAVTYTPAVGDAANIYGIIEYEQDDNLRPDASMLKDATLYVKKSDIADPDYFDTVTIAGTTWKIRHADPSDDDLIWILKIHRDERPVI